MVSYILLTILEGDFIHVKLLLALLLISYSTLALADVAGYPPTSYYVSPVGNDSNNGSSLSPFRTIQKGVSMAMPGQVVEVLSGNYRDTTNPTSFGEKVITTRSGTSNAPIRIVASTTGSAPTLAGFEIRHSYITIDGFSMDGTNSKVTTYTGIVYVRGGVIGLTLLNNYIHDSPVGLSAISFEMTENPPQNCIIKNNILSKLGRHMIMLSGVGHLVENNTLMDSNGWDGVWIFGQDHVVRKNYFTGFNEVSGNGNHIDIFQGFDDNGTESHDILIDRNFIVNSITQMGQINNDRYSTKVYNWTFTNNVFAKMNVQYNLNASIKGLSFHHNTFLSTGMVILGQVSDNSEIHSNAFVGNSSGSSGSGWYSSSTGRIYPGLFWIQYAPYITCTQLGLPYDSACQNEQKRLIDVNLLQDLKSKGYLGEPNGNKEYPILPSLLNVSNAQELGLSAPFTNFQDLILLTAKQVYLAKQNFSAHHNFVSGAAPTFAAKSSRCPEMYAPMNFCEPAGINGGDPGFVNINDPLGTDGIPFTADDGLKLSPSSRLCTAGSNSSAIGAYSCLGDGLERAGAIPGRVPQPSPRIKPASPTSLKAQYLGG
jgi:hypothetical protein